MLSERAARHDAPGVPARSDGVGAEPRPTGAPPRPFLAGALALIVLALLLRLAFMGRGFSFDELFSVVTFIETDSAWKTVSTSVNFNNHIAYSLLARLSEGLLGRSEWVLRLPALLLGLAHLLVTWRFAAWATDERLALLTLAALALSPEHLLWSTSARGYTGLLLCTVIATWLYLRLLGDGPAPKEATGDGLADARTGGRVADARAVGRVADSPSERRVAAGLAVATALGVYFHLYGVILALVQGGLTVVLLAIGWRDPAARPDLRRRATLIVGALAAAAGASLVLFAPVLPAMYFSLGHNGRGSFNPGFPWSVAQELSANTEPWIVVLAAAIGLVYLRARRPLLALYVLVVLWVPLLGFWLASPADLFPRYFVYFLPYYLFAAVVGAYALGRYLTGHPAGLFARRLRDPRPRRLAYAPSLLGAAAVLTSWVGQYPVYAIDEGFRDAVRALERGAADRTALCGFGVNAELFQRYAERPLEFPKTGNELQQLARRAPETHCVYRSASWESRGSAEIARFFADRVAAGQATVERIGDIALYRYRR